MIESLDSKTPFFEGFGETTMDEMIEGRDGTWDDS